MHIYPVKLDGEMFQIDEPSQQRIPMEPYPDPANDKTKRHGQLNQWRYPMTNEEKYKHALEQIYLISVGCNHPESKVTPTERLKSIAEYILKQDIGIKASQETINKTFE